MDYNSSDDILATFIPYKPSATPHDIFCAIFILLCVIYVYHILKKRDWWAFCLPVGCIVQAVGYLNRVKFAEHPTFGYYFCGDLFVTIAPVAYLAFYYIVFARMTYNLIRDDRVESKGSLAILPNRVFKTIFVLSDILTFLAQTIGGIMQIFHSVASIGRIVLILGIAAQSLSYFIFTLIIIRSISRWAVRSDDHLQRACIRTYHMLLFGSFCILLRSIYRCIELPTRPNGILAKSEIAFFILDATPLALAIATFAFFWPSNYLNLSRSCTGLDVHSKGSSMWLHTVV